MRGVAAAVVFLKLQYYDMNEKLHVNIKASFLYTSCRLLLCPFLKFWAHVHKIHLGRILQKSFQGMLKTDAAFVCRPQEPIDLNYLLYFLKFM